MNFEDLKNFDLNQLRTLDPNNMGSWPLPIRIITLIIIYMIVVGGGYWFVIKDQRKQLSKLQGTEATLKTTFEQKAAQAANLDTYKKQLEDMQKSFGTMLRQLPGKTEIPSLLQDISQAAQVDGLKQNLFRPGGEAAKDFYAEKPIDLVLEGGYHELGKFVSDVAALPRIVTLHNISIKPTVTGSGGSDNLTMTLTAKTYRYLEDDEQATKSKKPAKKGGRG